MTPPKTIDAPLRNQILSHPEIVLDDADLMKALVSGNDHALGANIVDMRGLAMERLEARLDRLEDMNRSVIAAAYENMAGMNKVHRAVLALLDADSFEAFLASLCGSVSQTLGVDAMRLVLESPKGADEPSLAAVEKVLCIAPLGSCAAYTGSSRPVLLRQTGEDGATIFGAQGKSIQSEACLNLSIGKSHSAAMLVMGANDRNTFHPQQGTDFLEFFAGVFERSLKRWLS